MGDTSSKGERRILVIDDDADFAHEQAALLAVHGYSPKLAHDSKQVKIILPDFDPHTALIDNRLISNSGCDIIDCLRSYNPRLHFVVQDVLPDTDSAVYAMRQGAVDYLGKSAEPARLLEALSRSFAASEPAIQSSKFPSGKRFDAVTQIRQYESLFNQATQLGNLGYWVWDEKENRCIYASEEYARIQGLTVDEVMNQYNTVTSDLALIHPDDREQFIKISETGSHEVYECEYRLIRPDGEMRYVYELGQDISNEIGDVHLSVGILQDVTERRQAEQDLKHSEALLSQAAQIAGLGHYVWDELKQRYVHVSNEFAEILGLTVDEVYGQYNSPEEDSLLLHPDDRAHVLASYEQAIQNSAAVDIEYRIIRPNGELRYLHETQHPISGDLGVVEQSVGVVRDITDQILAGEAQAERELLLAQAAKISKLGHAIWNDITLEYKHVSDEYAGIFGYTAEEFVARFRRLDDDMELVHPEDRARVQEFSDSTETALADCEYRIFHRDGSVRHVKEIMQGFTAEDGSLYESITTLQDITDLKQTQEALEEREAQFSHAARIAHLGYWQVDEVKQEYTSISEEYARIHGYSVDEFMARYRYINDDVETVHPADRRKLQETYDQGEREVHEFRIIHRDGSLRHVREKFESVFDDSGNALITFGYLQDINELKVVELELQAAKEAAENANNAKTEFLSRMSHELRTPMNAVLGFGQLLQTTPKERLQDDGPEFIDHIVKAGDHLLTLIDEVLDLARIDSGRISLSMEAVDLGVALKSCADLVQSMAENRQISLKIQIAPDSAPTLWADKTRLHQSVLNLLTNAVKYNREGGRVLVECGEARDGLLRINISDTGPGIAQADMARLYRPFERLQADGGGVQGTGIGLTITKRLVEMMGGRLGVDSSVGTGSTFWLELPIYKHGRSGLNANEATVTTGSFDTSFQALYIEDDPVSVVLMRALLSDHKQSSMLHAANAESGLQLARLHQPDIIFTDINLPGMNGFQVLKGLKEDEATRDIPVIAVSASAQDEDIERGRNAGFFEYLAKPIDLNLFHAALGNALTEIFATGGTPTVRED